MKIKFLPQNIEVEGTPNKSLLQIATENKLEIRSICKGVPSCAECRVRITEGERNVLPPTKAELNLIGSSHFIDGRRLSCQVRCYGDVTVDLSEQVERAEHQTKKIRGFRSQKQIESQAVNDTFLLDVKEEPTPRRDLQQPREAQGQDQGQEQSQEPGQPPQPQRQQQQRQGQQQQRQQGQQQPRNQGQQQQQPARQGQQQNQGRRDNSQRNNNNNQQRNNNNQPRNNQPRGNQQPQQARDNQPRNNQPREAPPRKDDNQTPGNNPKKDQT